jgi:nucleoid DNA-binding protein|tara:strand:- start:15314 stop:15724 length:411 start_codon:yes stop_codon:yes gene_type:complete
MTPKLSLILALQLARDVLSIEVVSYSMSTITKRDLVVRISNETGLTQQQVFDVVQKTLDAVTLELAQGNTVVMRNFGTFEVRQTKAKVGRNPKNPGKDVPIPPRAVVKFKPGKEMKEKVARILPVIQQQGQVDRAD